MAICLIKLNSPDDRASLYLDMFMTDFSDELEDYYRGVKPVPDISLLVSEINTQILPKLLSGDYTIDDVLETIQDADNAHAIKQAFGKLLSIRRQINLKADLPSYHADRKFDLVDLLISDLNTSIKKNLGSSSKSTMTISELRNYYDVVKRVFNDNEEIEKAININMYDGWSINEISQIDELNHFFGLDEDGPYSEFLSKGLKSLRPGFYVICDKPFYNISIFPHTYSASVLYFHPDYVDGDLIKYEANVGPLTNIHAIYNTLEGTLELDKIDIRNQFLEDKRIIGSSDDHYLIPKNNFYNKLFRQKKIFFVIESVYDPDYLHENPKPKRVTWSFIDY